ncbi:NAD-dependent epimerase/dehydratase family protein [Aestuariibaculum marinum]|uniref:NAD-dependent epimerase/dehydratase family protein n=1 Tax=Aestuariibaculum marinum TaxID=2683592 RepID=A0A8J6Q5J5_9FLAO|nr:NAD-dependent epimerase/dehydratase family protein [Aestuariibaculum marinum]MBD0825272.1 NAD-dependent epimerase/dehydratase family protein [Aestuariibaculum marinum]
MKVLVTGSTGYIGHELALALAKKKITVHALCRDIHSPKVPLHDKIILFKGDICDKSSLKKAIKDCEYVFHCAAFTNLKCKSINSFFETNVVGTENVLAAALNEGVKKFVFTSSLSVFGPSYKNIPITEEQPRLASYANDYELTKCMAEEKVKGYSKLGLPYVILNVSRVYGPNINGNPFGVYHLIEQMVNKSILLMPNRGEVRTNYVYVKDVVKAHIKVIKSSVRDENYIIGGENISYNTLFQFIKTLTKSKVRIIRCNYKMIRMVLSVWNALGSFFNWSSFLNPQVIDALFINRQSVSNKAKRDLKYTVTPLEKGLKKTIK